MSRLGIRLRLLAVVIAAVIAALAALIVGFNLLLEHNLSRDADNLLRARAAAALTLLRPVGDRRFVVEHRCGHRQRPHRRRRRRHQRHQFGIRLRQQHRVAGDVVDDLPVTNA